MQYYPIFVSNHVIWLRVTSYSQLLKPPSEFTSVQRATSSQILDANNHQDVEPSSLESDGFLPLPGSVLYALPEWTPQQIAPHYAKCPNKTTLKLHCKRNARLYPGYDRKENSGKGVSLQQFIKWVEKMDRQREERQNAYAVKERGCGIEWVDPTSADPKVIPRHALWVR